MNWPYFQTQYDRAKFLDLDVEKLKNKQNGMQYLREQMSKQEKINPKVDTKLAMEIPMKESLKSLNQMNQEIQWIAAKNLSIQECILF